MGDALVGKFVVIGSFKASAKSIERVARVEAWRLSDGAQHGLERRHYRVALLLGAHAGQLFEFPRTEVESGEPSVNVEAIVAGRGGGRAVRALAGGDGVVFRNARQLAELTDALARKGKALTGSYGSVVWAKRPASPQWWPSLVLDPRDLHPPSFHDARVSALKFLETKHLVRFLGEVDEANLGFVAFGSLAPWTQRHPLSQPEFATGTSQVQKRQGHYERGVAFARQIHDECAAQRGASAGREPPRDKPDVGSWVVMRWADDPRSYKCRVGRDILAGGLVVTSDDFAITEEALMPFDIDADEWESLPPDFSPECDAERGAPQPPVRTLLPPSCARS